MAPAVPPGGLPPLADDGTAHVGTRNCSAYRLSGHLLLCRPHGPQEEHGRRQGRHRPRAGEDLRQARHTAGGASGPLRRCRRCHHGLRFGKDNLQRQAPRAGHHLHVYRRSGEGAPRPRKGIPRQRGAISRQFLCRTQQRGILRWFFRLYTTWRKMPDGALILFPHQCRRYWTV